MATLAKVIRDEGMHVSSFSDSLEAQELTARDLPALAILEHDPPGIDGMSICRAIRAHESDHKYQLPVVMVSAQEGQVTGTAAGVTGLAGQTVQRRLCPDQDPRMGIPHHVPMDARGHARRGGSLGIARASSIASRVSPPRCSMRQSLSSA